MAELQVRSVRGRYPQRAVLRPQNIESQVVEEIARVYRIRLDDIRFPDGWMEIIVELETGGEPCAMKSASGLAS